MLAAQSLQAVSMIGHAVLVPGTQLDLLNGKANAAVELTQPVDSVSVNITDTSGNLVRTLQLGSQNSGVVQVQWDGRTESGSTAVDGSYQFNAAAVLSGKQSEATTLSYGLVNSVAQSQSGVTVNVGQLGEVSLTTIKQIL
jgi:flagellar basal-body rod modification protein FlgD